MVIRPAADAEGRPAMNAPKHNSAKAIVNVDTVLSLTPRTRFPAAAVGTIASFGDAGTICAEVAARRGFLLADAFFGIISLRFPNQVAVAANARIAFQASWGAIQGHTCAADAPRARKFPCGSFPARFRSP